MGNSNGTRKEAATEKGCFFLVCTLGLWPLWMVLYAVVTPDKPKPAPTVSPEVANMLSKMQLSPGQQAGYDWAKQNGIMEHDQCGGNSAAFVDGCREYVHDSIVDIGCDPDQAYDRCVMPD